MSEASPKNSGISKDLLAGILLLVVVGEFAAGYYYWGQKTGEIEELSVTVRDQTITIDAAEKKMALLEKTIKDLEAGGAKVAAPGTDRSADYAYAAGGVMSAWNKLLEVRRQFQQNPQAAELGELMTTEDFNGVRGPESKEIECFETLLASGDQPLLKSIFEHNAKEALRSGDLGTSASVTPGLENLMAFYVTLGDDASVNFVRGFLTTGPAAQLLQTRFGGSYFTSAESVVGPLLEGCVGTTTP